MPTGDDMGRARCLPNPPPRPAGEGRSLTRRRLRSSCPLGDEEGLQRPGDAAAADVVEPGSDSRDLEDDEVGRRRMLPGDEVGRAPRRSRIGKPQPNSRDMVSGATQSCKSSNNSTPQRSLGSTFSLSETTGERWGVQQLDPQKTGKPFFLTFIFP